STLSLRGVVQRHKIDFCREGTRLSLPPNRQTSKTKSRLEVFRKRRITMFKKMSFLLPILGTIVALSIPCIGSAQNAKPVYYWVSHGSPTDPVWTYFLQGAEQWAK